MGSKRPKPHFTEVFAFPKRPKGLVWDAWKSGFQLVFTGLGTLGGMTKNAAEKSSPACEKHKFEPRDLVSCNCGSLGSGRGAYLTP